MKTIVSLSLVLLLYGCGTTSGLNHEQMVARDDAICLDYGYKKGTDAFANCRMELAQNRQVATKHAIQQMQVKPYQLPPPVQLGNNNRARCTSNAVGATVYTNCQ